MAYKFDIDFSMSSSELTELLKKTHVVLKRPRFTGPEPIHEFKWTSRRNTSQLILVDKDWEHMSGFRCHAEIVPNGGKSTLRVVARLSPMANFVKSALIAAFIIIAVYNTLLYYDHPNFLKSFLIALLFVLPFALAAFFGTKSGFRQLQNAIVDSIGERIAHYELK